MKPTSETYSELQLAYDTFNDKLFGGALPQCLITLQREKQTCGYFSYQRFANKAGEKTDEIALNPSLFAVTPLLETMQTLVHEMTHLWQYHFGEPGRGRYHNQQWADKMESIGLMPSSTGRPGGKKTGDRMADYAIKGGLFLEVCSEMLTNDYKISWYDRFPSDRQVYTGLNSFGLSLGLPPAATEIAAYSGLEMGCAVAPLPGLPYSGAQGSGFAGVVAEHVDAGSGGLALMDDGTDVVLSSAFDASGAVGFPGGGALDGQMAVMPPMANRTNRSKYTCSCGYNVWGKPGLRLSCDDCHSAYGEAP